MRIAIIDLGTNTFNLLIVSTNSNKSFAVEVNTKEVVKLGKGGINSKTILPEAIERGLKAIQTHMAVINSMGVETIYAFATSAIRSASNGNHFVNLLKEKYGLHVEVISGEREAELVYRGVAQAVDLSHEKHLIVDIGGGSNEFIIANHQEIFYKNSFPLGISRLLDKFNPSDPITQAQILQVESYLKKELQPLFDVALIHKPNVLVGSSGSFDTYRSLLTKGANPSTPPSYAIEMHDYKQLHLQLLKSTAAERTAMPGMETARVEMIVLASILTNLVIEKLEIAHMIQSCYALREGAIWEITHNYHSK